MYQIFVEINGVEKKYVFLDEDKYLTFLDGVMCGLDLCDVKYTFKETIDERLCTKCVVLKSV